VGGLEALYLRLKSLFQEGLLKIDAAGSNIATETTLSGIKAQTDRFQFDANNYLRTTVAGDEVGLARDATLQQILGEMSNVGVGSRASGSIILATAADISGGVEATLPAMTKWTLFLHADATVDIYVYLSPDGINWFQITESPISFSAAGDQTVEFGYVARAIKLVASNTTPVTAMIYYVV
jgi:hypothetical protein